MEKLNELYEIPEKSSKSDESIPNQRLRVNHADGLEGFSTRLHAEKKANLLRQARKRGIAAGQIIEELMDQNIPEALERIERKLDLLLSRLPEMPSKDATVLSPSDSTVHDFRHTTPEGIAAIMATSLSVSPSIAEDVTPPRPRWWKRRHG